VDVDEHTTSLGDLPAYYRSASPMADTPALYVHGIPTSSDDWIDFLARTGGLAPDLIGFGRTGKGGHLDFSLDGMVDFIEDFLAHLEVEEVQIVGHDWGAAAGLKFAGRHPERVRRLVLLDPPALIEGFEPPRFVRWWQLRGVGEMLMGATTRTVLARMLRRGSVEPDAWPKARIDAVWDQFDQGTQRAVLHLVRSAEENMVGDGGLRGNRGTAPEVIENRARAAIETTVIWGDEDPWYPPALGDAYAARLPGAQVEHIAGAGHWPWLDRPEVVERVAALLEG
jgi:pimeloyl-ACP methyl ester carboxylesterase